MTDWVERACRPENPPREGRDLSAAELAALRWVWTGRARLFRRLVGFTAGTAPCANRRSPRNLMLVTGRPGSGAGALTARLVALGAPDGGVVASRMSRLLEGCDPRTVPEPGSVTAAVDAAGATAEGLAGRIAAGLAVPAFVRSLGPAPAADAGPERILRHAVDARLSSAPGTVLVIDRLDQAQDPLRCLATVVLPAIEGRSDAGNCFARVVLGFDDVDDGPGAGLLEETWRLAGRHRVELLRVDGDAARREVSGYVRTLLLADPGSPYLAVESRAAPVAAAVSRRTGAHFEQARAMAVRLRREPATVPASQVLAGGALDDALTLELHDALQAAALHTETTPHLPLAALRALALGQDRWLARPDWELLTTAVLGAPAPTGSPAPEAVDAVETVADGPLTPWLRYRADHDAWHLASRTVRGLVATFPHRVLDGPTAGATAGLPVTDDEVQAHRRITAMLRADADDRGLRTRYACRHLTAHAALAGVLDDETVPVTLLPADTDVAELGRRLGHGLRRPEQRALAVRATLAPRPELVRPADRLATLRFHLLPRPVAPAGEDLHDGLHDAAHDGLPGGWWDRSVDEEARDGAAGPLVATTVDLGGDRLPAVAVADRLHLLDPFLGTVIGAAVRLPGPVLRSTGGRDGRGNPLLVVAGPSGVLRLDPRTGWRRGVSPPAGADGTTALALSGEGTAPGLLAVACSRGLLHRIDATTGSPVAEPQQLPSPARGVAVAAGPGGRTVIVTGDDLGQVRFWDASTGESVAPPASTSGGTGLIDLRLVRDGRGRSLVLSLDTDGQLACWDPGRVGQAPVWSWPRHHGVRSVGVRCRAGRGVLLVATADALQECTPGSGEPLGPPAPHGLDGQLPVAVLGVHRRDGVSGVVVVSAEGEIRAWRDGAAGPVILRHRDLNRRSTVHVAAGARGPALLSAGSGRTPAGVPVAPPVTVHDVRTGRRRPSPWVEEPRLRDVVGVVDSAGHVAAGRYGNEVLVGLLAGTAGSHPGLRDVTGRRTTTLRRPGIVTRVLLRQGLFPPAGWDQQAHTYLAAPGRNRLGRPILVVAPRDPWRRRLQRVDVSTSRPVGLPFGPRVKVVSLIPCTGPSGRPAVLTGDLRGQVEMWDTATGSRLAVWTTYTGQSVTALGFSRTGRTPDVVAALAGGRLWRWTLPAAGPPASTTVADRDLRSRALAVGGHPHPWIAWAGADGRVVIGSADLARTLAVIDVGRPVSGLAAVPAVRPGDPDLLAIAGPGVAVVPVPPDPGSAQPIDPWA